jgi:hypothetical protein
MVISSGPGVALKMGRRLSIRVNIRGRDHEGRWSEKISPLRDESSAHTYKPYVDANGRCRIGYASIQICARASASPAQTAALSVAHFERNDVIIIWETVHTE